MEDEEVIDREEAEDEEETPRTSPDQGIDRVAEDGEKETEMNEGEDEELLKKYGPRPLPPLAQPSAQEMEPRSARTCTRTHAHTHAFAHMHPRPGAHTHAHTHAHTRTREVRYTNRVPQCNK